jgi:hypothetical protein
MWALPASGVEFRDIVNDDGTIERWQQPELADWELPRRDPAEPRPMRPRYLRSGEPLCSDGELVNALSERGAERRYETDFPTSARRRLRDGGQAVSYDHWKGTNPADEWLGPEPRELDDKSESCEHTNRRAWPSSTVAEYPRLSSVVVGNTRHARTLAKREGTDQLALH